MTDPRDFPPAAQKLNPAGVAAIPPASSSPPEPPAPPNGQRPARASLADRVWATGHEHAEAYARHNPDMGTRHAVNDAIEDFAATWDTTFGPFAIHDPNHPKHLARWITMYLKHLAGQRCGHCNAQVVDGQLAPAALPQAYAERDGDDPAGAEST